MKKLLFVIHTLEGGGAEKVLVNLVNNLPREKHKITVAGVFDGGVNKRFLKDDIEYIFLFKRIFRGNCFLFKNLPPEKVYKKLVGERHFDIVISYLEGITARIVSGCRDKQTKKICWIHRELDEAFYKGCFKSKKEADRIYASFDRIVCVANGLISNFCSFNGLYEKTLCLYNVNETAEIIKKSRESADEAFLSDNVVKICFVGKIIKNKGVLRLLRAHEILCEKNIPHRFVLIGTGPLKGKIEFMLKEKGIEKDFIFAGYQTNPYRLLSRCDIFALPSYFEGFSTATTEALILGLPCVVTECSGMSELLGENNEYGIVAKSEGEFYSALEKMVTDKKFREHYARKAEIRGEKFSMKETLKAHEKLFDELTEATDEAATY